MYIYTHTHMFTHTHKHTHTHTHRFTHTHTHIIDQKQEHHSQRIAGNCRRRWFGRQQALCMYKIFRINGQT